MPTEKDGLKELIQRLQSEMHELKNHIQNIYMINQYEEYHDILSTYVYKCDHLLTKIHMKDYIKDDIILRTLIEHQKLLHTFGINFKILLDCCFTKLPLKRTEILEILINLLKNSKEYLIECEDYQCNRYMQIRLKLTGSKIILSILNSMEESINIKDITTLGFSMKGRGRGYGLNRVKDVVESNKGIININIKKHKFIVSITFELEEG